MAHTKKPCPGCGKSDWRRSSDSVCAACKQLLEEAKKARDWKNAKSEGFEIVTVPPKHRSHCFPRFYMGERGETRDQLEKLIINLIYTLSEEMGVNDYVGVSFTDVPTEMRKILTHPDFCIYGIGHKAMNGCWNDLTVFRKMKPEHAELIRDLYNAIAIVLEETHEDAKKKGQNILLSLANGDLTIDEFNKRSLKK